MPVSDDAHQQVLHRLDDNSRALTRIEAQTVETNRRVSKLELKQAISEDRADQAAKALEGQARKRFSRHQVILGAAGVAAAYGGIFAAILASH